MKTLLILNGPNLNLLGDREPHIYGSETLAEINARLSDRAEKLGLRIIDFQSNHEGALIDAIHEAKTVCAGIIINPGAYSHSSIALLDALMAYDGLVAEVHLSNIHKREEFRHHSYISRRADAVLIGLGALGYDLAMDWLASKFS